jgi:hypothetical protein
LRELAVGRAAEDFHFWLERKHCEAVNLGAREWRWQPSKLANPNFFRDYSLIPEKYS